MTTRGDGIKLKMREALVAEKTLEDISKLKGWETNGTGAYRTERVRRRIARETEHYHKRHAELLKELGEQRKPTPTEVKQNPELSGPFVTITTVKPEHEDAFTAAIDPILDVEVLVDTASINIADFAGVSITPQMFRALWPFVEETE